MAHRLQANIFNKSLKLTKEHRRVHINLRLIFGRFQDVKGETRIFRSWKEWHSQWSYYQKKTGIYHELIGVENPFVDAYLNRPIQVGHDEWLWFVNDAPCNGLDDQSLLLHLNDALDWANKNGLGLMATNGAQVVDSDLVRTDERRNRLILDWAVCAEATHGVEIALFSLDNTFLHPDVIPSAGTQPFAAPHEVMRTKTTEGGTLFYPGAFCDWGALRIFADAGKFDQAIYCDYHYDHYSRSTVVQPWKKSGFQVLDVREIEPEEWGLEYWQQLWDPRANCYGMLIYGHLKSLHAYELMLERHGRQVSLLMMPAEAIGTLRFLLSRQVPLHGLVLQDHGLGGQWTCFGGKSLLCDVFAEYAIWPELILCAEGTTIWSGYEAISGAMLYRGQACRFKRRLYRCTLDHMGHAFDSVMGVLKPEVQRPVFEEGQNKLYTTGNEYE